MNAAPVPGSGSRSLRAVTFDFWDTLMQQVPALQLRAAAVAKHLGIEEVAVAGAIEDAFVLQTETWRSGREFGLKGLVQHLSRQFQVSSPAGLRSVIAAPHLLAASRPAPHAAETLAELRAAGLRLGIVSDTGFSPGSTLRQLLAEHCLLDHFQPSALAFSDEVGVPKPAAKIFQVALTGLDTRPEETAHIGDLRCTDVAGARALGMITVRYRGCHDDLAGAEADMVVDDLSELPSLLLPAVRGN
ncbi:MAG: HAD family hydrolase [Candidatus Dormibacteraeota bacterium]|uniref:HAD family hydrolase n=1 Tax=Candidatus Dormiibacter inghamiae TaxID=3127013 RepID=A0A934NEB3_9BACT|nr:HAD family hydrolase [Candidatus Dormibacteraeota bacterium]MBJ7607208.1 HAD family hydrolase [Candidatus Dormibacteraeota bacterium]